jgi:heat shock protein HtpX
MGFIGRSLLVLMVLYGLVFAVGDVLLLHGDAPVWWGLVFVTGFVLVQYLMGPVIIEWIYSIDFESSEIPAAQREFVERLCKERGYPMPKLGIIYSGTPNAFAFGRLRGDARVVMTEGLLNVLTDEEANAVLAHEVGHIAHYDFAVMALASIAPLLLYQIYVWTRRINNQARVVSYFAYIAYWVGQFLVLLLNRTREYGADHFAAEATKQPSALASALVKIGYGMVRERSELQRRIAEKGAGKQARKDAERALSYGQSVSLMGIASVSGNQAMALAAATAGTAATPEDAARVMRWDLVNPWSRFYELNSTHPLTAMRLRALNKEAAKLGQQPVYPLPENTRMRWGSFPAELFIWAAPLVCGFLIFTWFWIGKSLREVGVLLPTDALAWLFLLMGMTWAAKILVRYRGAFQRRHVGDLLDEMDASQMRPVAVEMEGEIIGHGVPGAFWSPDLVMQDETGMMFILYRSSVPFGRLFFALRSGDRMIGERVVVQGWYRRGLKPYVELARVEARLTKARRGRGMTTLFGGEGADAPIEYETMVERSYSRWIQLAAAAVCTAGGVIALLASR